MTTAATDGGWRPVSLPESSATYLGQVDERLLAATVEGTGVEVSDDLGETWTQWS